VAGAGFGQKTHAGAGAGCAGPGDCAFHKCFLGSVSAPLRLPLKNKWEADRKPD
jgi:hypothetical protein